MNETPASLPKAVVHKKRPWTLSIVWIIPLIAALTGGWLAVSAILNQGPTITIVFDTAESLEVKRTKIKYKDVDIGVVQEIRLSDNHEEVKVIAQLDKKTEPLLREDTQFWVVKARIGSGGVSGLNTLLSGAYIGVEEGSSAQKSTEFVGLNTPPVLTYNKPGKTFTLKARDLGSIDYGSPVYYRRINVGEVVAYRLDEDGNHVSVDIFIHAPYDHFVLNETRFWPASGFDVTVGTDGFELSTQSLASIIMGGIAFATPEEHEDSGQAEEKTAFILYRDQKEAFRKQLDQGTEYEVIFTESVHGLNPGAPVELLGIPVGEVVSVNIAFDDQKKHITIPVKIVLYPGWLDSYASVSRHKPFAAQERLEIMKQLVESGLRAQMRTSNLLTGRLYIMLDFFPDSGKATLNTTATPMILPTVAGDLQSVQTSLTTILRKLEQIPYGDLVGDLRTTLQTLKETIDSAQTLILHLDQDIAPQVSAAVEDAQKTLEKSNRLLEQDSPVQQELRDALREVSRTAQSIRDLTEYLSQHPESLLRGKPKEENR